MIKIMSIILATLADSINPCAFAILIFLISTLLLKSKRNAIASGISFILAIFISYFLMGLGLYSAITLTNITNYFKMFIIVLSLYIGIKNIIAFFSNKPNPCPYSPRLQKTFNKYTSVKGAFVIGFLVSLFLLPCSAGPYVIAISLLTPTTKISLLLLYNLIFILPMLFITFLVGSERIHYDKIVVFQAKNRRLTYLVTGIIMVVLAIIITFSLEFNFNGGMCT